MNVEITVALIGILSTCLTQLVAQFFFSRREKRVRNNELIIRYLEPLKRQIAANVKKQRRVQERKKIRKENNSIRVIEGRVMETVEDMEGVELEWFYKHGANLGSSCYQLACLIAYVYQIDQYMTFVNFPREQRQRLRDYIDEFQGILDENHGIYRMSQFDIGNLMFAKETKSGYERLISYDEFCRRAQDRKTNCCLTQLFNFILSIANEGWEEKAYDEKSRTAQWERFLRLLEEFHTYLERIVPYS